MRAEAFGELADAVILTPGRKAAVLSVEARRPSYIMGTKPKIHITDPNPESSVGGLQRTLCGLYVPREHLDKVNPSCQKCLRFRHSPRRLKERQQKN